MFKLFYWPRFKEVTVMRKLLLAIAVAAALTLSAARSASAHQGHGSCAGFGVFISEFAKTGESGTVVSGIATSAPGALSEATVGEHDLYCEPAP